VSSAGGSGGVGPSLIGAMVGVPTGPGDGSTTTPWKTVILTELPYLPELDRPVRWSFETNRVDYSYDVDTFTIEYKHYVPAG